MCNKECRSIPLSIRKIDSVSGLGIPGAVFELTACNGYTCNGATDSNGLFAFFLLPCTEYMLKEVIPSPGYSPVDPVYNICVDACGCIFVDGVPTSQLVISNTPVSALFTAIKVNIENGMPLAGAVYTLSMNSTVVATTVSNSAGQVIFSGLAPGTYELVETTPPAGFQADTGILTVVVDRSGSITINGRPANGFILNNVPLTISEPPTIDTILEGAQVITGTGVPGSLIMVTLPNGSTVSATVATEGTWIVNVPAGVELAVGDTISANQTETGRPVSGDVHTIVIGNTGIEPGIDIFVENLTGLNYAQAGDLLLYDIIVSNNGTASSVWPSAYATFYLSSSVTLQENSIRINNRTATPNQYSYDSTANTLTVYLGNMVGGSRVSISYRVIVNSDISDINEIILDVVLGSLVTRMP